MDPDKLFSLSGFFMSKINIIIKNNKFVSAHVVIIRDGKVLILRRSSTDEWMPGHYGLPGGKLNSGEETKQAVCRECMEEASIKISPEDLIFLPKVSKEKQHAFFCTSKSFGEPKLDFEHDDFVWVKPSELSNYKVVPDLPNIINTALEEIM